jgi:hypothetical protein
MKWEYRRIRAIGDISKDQILDEMGNEGWELVAAIRVGNDITVELYFKKPKQE